MDELPELTSQDLTHLRRCVDLAREAFSDGDEPLGSLPTNAVAPGLPVAGPALELADDVRGLHRQYAEREAAS